MGSFSGSNTKRFKIIENQFINVKTLGAKGDGVTNDAPFIQKALDMAFLQGGGTVLIPEGGYRIGGRLYIRSNTAIILHQNTRMLRGWAGGFMMNYYSNADPLTIPYDSFSGYGNITIEGGIWDGNVLNEPYTAGSNGSGGFNLFSFTRARDITFRNMTFKDMVTNHALDLAALENVLVDNCNFLGYKDSTTDGTRDYPEAIQLSPFTQAGSGGTGVFDGTPVKNITIQNCYFGSSDTPGMGPVATGIGNHAAVLDQYVQDVKIINNTFEGMTYAGVRPFKFKNCKISGNTFINCRNDIQCSAHNGTNALWYDVDKKDIVTLPLATPQSGSYINVTENHFVDTKNLTLYARGWTNDKGIGWWDNIRFTNNTFERSGADATGEAVQITWARNVVIRDNQVIRNVVRGVRLYNCYNATVENNRIEHTQYEGILVSELDDTFKNQGYTGNINIRNNSLESISYQGIYLAYAKSGTVTGNRLMNVASQSDNSRDAIYLFYSDNIEIDGNYINTKEINRPRYGVGIHINCNYCRVGSNNINRVASNPFYVFGTNFMGDYMINTPNALWTGNNRMGEVSPGTVVEITPSKKLSECKNGWILIWSDWNAVLGDVNSDFNYSIIPKYISTVQNGKLHYFPIANYLDATKSSVTVKKIIVYDESLKGHADNTVTETESYDVTLRYILEW